MTLSSTIFTETTTNTAPTDLIQASQYVGSGDYHSPVLNGASESAVSTEVTTHYTYSSTTTVSSAVRVDQQVTTAKYKATASSRSVDLESSVVIIPLPTSATRIYTSLLLYSAVTEQEIIADIDPSLATTARKSSQAVTVREAVAWALFSLMTLMFIGTLSVTTIILCMQKYKQERDNTAEIPAYEMEGNPCYESSKMDNAHGTNLYEPIESERV